MFPKKWTNGRYQRYKAGMDYRDILRDQLKRRQELNPRFSLRSFAAKIGIAPSKISEVLSGKKKLSTERLEEVAKKLSLKGPIKEIFLASAELEAAKNANKDDIRRKLQRLSQQIIAEKTKQENAWYFGAVKCLEDEGLDSASYRLRLGLTDLQVESAKRFRQRIKRFHPERDDLTFQHGSLAKKINESLQYSDTQLLADFAWLNPADVAELQQKIRNLIKKQKANASGQAAGDLQMMYFGVFNILKGDN